MIIVERPQQQLQVQRRQPFQRHRLDRPTNLSNESPWVNQALILRANHCSSKNYNHGKAHVNESRNREETRIGEGSERCVRTLAPVAGGALPGEEAEGTVPRVLELAVRHPRLFLLLTCSTSQQTHQIRHQHSKGASIPRHCFLVWFVDSSSPPHQIVE